MKTASFFMTEVGAMMNLLNMKNSIRNQIPHAIGWALMFHDHLENLAEGTENENNLVFLSDMLSFLTHRQMTICSIWYLDLNNFIP